MLILQEGIGGKPGSSLMKYKTAGKSAEESVSSARKAEKMARRAEVPPTKDVLKRLDNMQRKAKAQKAIQSMEEGLGSPMSQGKRRAIATEDFGVDFAVSKRQKILESRKAAKSDIMGQMVLGQANTKKAFKQVSQIEDARKAKGKQPLTQNQIKKIYNRNNASVDSEIFSKAAQDSVYIKH